MISINKQGNAIVIEFTDNDKYLFNGTIEVAPNELMIVIDESNMATFKRSNNGDTLFSQLINKIQIGGTNVTKDTILDEFAKIGFTTGSGGAVNSVNGQTGDVVITATSLGAITKSDADTLYAAKSDLNSKADISAVEALSTEVANKADKTSVYTKAEADEKFATNVELNHVKAELATKADTSSLNDYALKSEITGLATKEELADYQPIGDYATTTQLNSKQDTLVSGQNIKTINGQSVIGEGNIYIKEGGTIDSELSTDSENAVQNKVITNALNDKASKTELSNVSTSKANKADVYTKQEVDNKFTNAQTQINQISTDTAANNAEIQTLKTDKQDTLVSGTNIKTINGQSLLGEGNIEIQQSELPIASADTLGGVKVGTGLSINPESGVLSADSPEWNNISGKPEDIVNITERLASKLDTATYNSEKSSFATKDELNSKADASAIADMATQTWVQGQGYLTEVPSDYVTNSELTEGLAGKQDKGNYALKSDLNTLATKEELATKADASALSSKQDTLVSGTNIKTINGDSILGSGNLVIQSGTSNWDDIQGKPQFAEVATSGDYNDLINKPTIPDVSGLATKEEIADMETKSNAAATYATKEEIPSLEGYLTKTEASETYATKQALGNKLDTATYNSEKAGFETKENAAATYQVKGDYATKQEIAGKQDTLVSGTNIKTINGNSVLGAGDIVIQAGGTIDTAMSDTSENAVQNKVIKKYIDDLVGNILTQLQEINGTIA